jgi:DNA-directed RNA polymerase beta' subunit
MAKYFKELNQEPLQCLSVKKQKKSAGEAEHLSECGTPINLVGYDKTSNRIVNNDVKIPNRIIYALFSKISATDVELLGFKGYRPENLLMTFVIVIPPSMREITLKGVDDKKTDFFGQEYKAILKAKNTLRKEKRPDVREKLISAIHDRIWHIFTSSHGTKNTRPGVQEFKGYKEELTGKEGLERQAMMGKRLDYTARAVLGGDPTITFGYVGVPKVICDKNYRRLQITPHTKPYLEKLLKQGQLVHYFPKKG